MNAPMPRQIPHDVGAERAVLGAVLLNPDSLHLAAELGLDEGSFYREPHRLLWEVFGAVDKVGPVDLVTVAGELEKRGKLEAIGGYSYLAGLPASTPSVANLERYVEVIASRARSRSLLTAAAEATGRIYDGDHPDEVGAQLQAAITDGAPMPSSSSWESDTVERVYMQIRSGRRGAEALPTGVPGLDAAIEGLLVGNVTAIVGDTGSGKSALADQIAQHLGVEMGFPGLYSGYEMTRIEMTERRLARLGRVNYTAVRKGQVADHQMPHIVAASEKLHSAPIVTDEGIYTAARWLSQVRSGVRRYGLRWVVLDHAHLAPGSQAGMNPAERIEEVAQAAKQAAKLGVAVLVVAQMNARVRERRNKRPTRGDIKYGGALEQIATSIVGVYRDELYNEQSEVRGMAELWALKARFGTGGRVVTRWRGEFQSFDPITTDGGWS